MSGDAETKQEFEIEINSAFQNVSMHLLQLVDNVAPHLMRLQHALTCWDRQQNGEVDIVRVHRLIERIRTELLEGEKSISRELAEAHLDCEEVARNLDKNLKHCSGLVDGMVRMTTGLQHEVVALKGEMDARLQEHSPASPELRAKVLALTGGKCAYCDAEITSDSSDGNANFVIEHVVPKSCGGPDHFANYVPACSKCNAQKSAGHVLEFIQRRLVSARVELAEAAE